MDLLKFIVTTTYFSFRGVIYQQKFGAAMGSPVSSLLSKLFMEWLEKQAIAIAPVESTQVLEIITDRYMVCNDESSIPCAGNTLKAYRACAQELMMRCVCSAIDRLLVKVTPRILITDLIDIWEWWRGLYLWFPPPFIINKNNLSILVEVGLEIVGSSPLMNMVKFCLLATGINCRYDNIVSSANLSSSSWE